MSDNLQVAFLGQRLRELRLKQGFTLDDLASKFYINKSTLSRVESGKTTEKTVREMAEKYCKEFGMSEEQTAQFLRGERVAVPDTSALLRNPQLIDELDKEYSVVVIPKVVVDELDRIKNRTSGPLGRTAWKIIRGISYGQRIVLREYSGNPTEDNDDLKIIAIAQAASEEFHSKVEIITDDTDYSAYLKLSPDDSVIALHLHEYMVTKQSLFNMIKLNEIDAYYADSYEGREPPSKEEANAHLTNGNTLIISTVRNRQPSFQQRKEKILWLIDHGASVDICGFSDGFLPAISHAIQANEYDMFLFLLEECHANPNIGSKNPYGAGKFRQKNQGNMPLMIAAWLGRSEFVEALLKDKRTSINQQDANGFTALIKASANGYTKCIRLLKEAGADQKIVDINGKTAEDWYNECLEKGKLVDRLRKDRRSNPNQRGSAK